MALYDENQPPQVTEADIDAVLQMLENFTQAEESRMKIVTSDTVQQGETKKQYHLGRCDVGSPWAKGQAFDVLPDPCSAGEIVDVTDFLGNK